MGNSVYIDGVNVAECEHLLSDGKRKPICKSGGSCRVYKSCLCVDNSDCHFKQLQRAKAELGQYKKSKQASYEAMQEQWNNAVNELRDVKSENEKLKKELDDYKRVD